MHPHTGTPTTIAILTDIHFGSPSKHTQRRTDIADILLLRVVHRLNRYIKPDITLVLGDILDAGDALDATERRQHIRNILDKLESQLIVIPGNHDGDVVDFYQDFPRPKPIEVLGSIRFLPFVDVEAPGYNATRSAADLGRFQQARSDFDGLIVALQHVCLHPEGMAAIPYNYTNAESIISEMERTGVALSVSGHFHEGVEHIMHNNVLYANAPGLCEYPFKYTIIKIDSNRINVEAQQLTIPKSLNLVDNHVHTQLAYCQENMTVSSATRFAEEIGLQGIAFAEHSGQLYFPQKEYWGGACYQLGIGVALPGDNRIAEYLKLKFENSSSRVRFGLEVDIDFQGRLLLRDTDRNKVDFLLGSVHSTPNIKTPGTSLSLLSEEFMGLMEHLLRHNVAAIAHPFRVFRRAQLAPPENLYIPVADMLAEYGAAAEINFHINEPPVQFIRACLERGVKFTLGSDAHNLYEVGEFAPHLKLLNDAGYNGDLGDILLEKPV